MGKSYPFSVDSPFQLLDSITFAVDIIALDFILLNQWYDDARLY